MKIILDREKCISCGSCASVCPKYFKMGRDGKAELVGQKKTLEEGVEEVDIKEKSCSVEAADSCPVEIISVVE